MSEGTKEVELEKTEMADRTWDIETVLGKARDWMDRGMTAAEKESWVETWKTLGEVDRWEVNGESGLTGVSWSKKDRIWKGTFQETDKGGVRVSHLDARRYKEGKSMGGFNLFYAEEIEHPNSEPWVVVADSSLGPEGPVAAKSFTKGGKN